MQFKGGSLRKSEKIGCPCLCDVVHKIIAQGGKLAAFWRREGPQYRMETA